MKRKRETVTLVRTNGLPLVIRDGAPSVGVWSLCHCADGDGWSVVHRPTGLTLWFMRCARFGLDLLDALGDALPDYGAGLCIGTAPDPHTDDAKRAREIALTMDVAWDDVEETYWKGEHL